MGTTFGCSAMPTESSRPTPSTTVTSARPESHTVEPWPVLDDLLGFLLYRVGQPAVTRSLTIDYLAPVLLEVPYQLRAHITGAEGRKLFVEAAVTGAAGEDVARARALFLLVDVAHFSNALGD
jgi:hypothetical protein